MKSFIHSLISKQSSIFKRIMKHKKSLKIQVSQCLSTVAFLFFLLSSLSECVSIFFLLNHYLLKLPIFFSIRNFIVGNQH
ncbi:unnamed protein product [Trichobilharzia regenti]|nr:unnamed protein product [Trichobilharzia regenti]